MTRDHKGRWCQRRRQRYRVFQTRDRSTKSPRHHEQESQPSLQSDIPPRTDQQECRVFLFLIEIEDDDDDDDDDGSGLWNPITEHDEHETGQHGRERYDERAGHGRRYRPRTARRWNGGVDKVRAAAEVDELRRRGVVFVDGLAVVAGGCGERGHRILQTGRTAASPSVSQRRSQRGPEREGPVIGQNSRRT